MLALEVEYLLGRALATAPNDRNLAEWPPHPARLFSALVATLHEAELTEGERATARQALAWLEQQAPPHLYADPPRPGHYARAVLDAWVPVNPTQEEVANRRKIPKASLGEGLTIPRKRAGRTFPAFTPHDPRVVFIWPAAEPPDHYRPVLERLARELGYLGHSMSPVRARWLDRAPTPTLEPRERGELTLRVPGPGRLARLEECHRRGLELKRRIEPPLGRYQTYALATPPAADQPARGLYRIAAVFRPAGGPHLPLEAAVALADGVRTNLLRLAPQPVAEVISGHTPDGRASPDPHLAVVPLPFVGAPRLPAGADPLAPQAIVDPLGWQWEHADGSLKGFAILAPVRLSLSEQEAIELALHRLPRDPLLLGRLGEWQIVRLSVHDRSRSLRTLEEHHWTEPSRHWASVSPVVFGHHPRAGNPRRDALAILSRACEDIGLPPPLAVDYGPVSAFRGTVPAPRYRHLDHSRVRKLLTGRFLAHIRLRFAQPVAGPLVLGAGRFFGLGLCRPLMVEETP